MFITMGPIQAHRLNAKSICLGCNNKTSRPFYSSSMEPKSKLFMSSRIVWRNKITRVSAQSSGTAIVESTTQISNDWAQFAAVVSGEWDGVTATFDRDGDPQELPSYYVPEAYRDWDVKIHDWQSQCSMIADEQGLKYMLRRLMPTVGCEADAIAFTEEQQHEGTPILRPSIAYDSHGNYAFAATSNDISSKTLSKAKFEHCIQLAPGQRIRIIHVLKRMGADQVWKLMEIELHRERYDCEFTGRRELAGCGGGLDLYATAVPLDVEKTVLDAGKGVWKQQGIVYKNADSNNNEEISFSGEIEPNKDLSTPSLPNIIGLPLNVWSSTVVDGDNAELIAGVVLDEESKKMRVSKLIVKNGRVAGAEIMAAFV